MTYVISSVSTQQTMQGPPVLGLEGQKARTGSAEWKALAHELLLTPAQLCLPR